MACFIDMIPKLTYARYLVAAEKLCEETLAWSVKEFFIDNLLVRIHFIIVMIWWTGLALWEFEFHFSGSLSSALELLEPWGRVSC